MSISSQCGSWICKIYNLLTADRKNGTVVTYVILSFSPSRGELNREIDLREIWQTPC